MRILKTDKLMAKIYLKMVDGARAFSLGKKNQIKQLTEGKIR